MAYQSTYPTYGNPYQTYPYQQQAQPPVQIAQQPAYSARPVTSREEALGAQVDFFGAGTLMPDLAHGVVYLKRFNQNTGASDLFEFRIAEPTPPNDPQRDELEELRGAIRRLEADMEKLKRVKVGRKTEGEANE